jgi:phytoene dehydrogenase-like protein
MSTIAIIGAGMGGLVAGNLLAKKGHKVTIFESQVTPGGYSSGFWRKLANIVKYKHYAPFL